MENEGGGTTLAQVCNFWKEFNLERRRVKLDEVALQVAEYQEECMESRRKLAEATKEFRRGADVAVVKSVGDLLKQYQQEVDRLTKRAKHGESAYLDVYGILYEAPDPSDFLSAGLGSTSRISELEAHVRKQAQELAEHLAEAKDLRNQDLTIRRLEEKVRGLEGELVNRNAEVGKVRQEADEEVQDKMMERENRLQNMLRESQESLETMRKLHQASQDQMFALRSETEEEKAGYRSELEIAVSEIEHAQERMVALEAEKSQLVMALESLRKPVVKDGNPASPEGVEDGLMAELIRQREVANALRGELAHIKAELEECKEGALSRLDAMKEALRAKDKHVEALEAELGARPTTKQMDDLTEKVRMLQAIQYSSVEGEDALDPDAQGSSGLHNPMERILLQKNRHLEHDITVAKLKEVEAQEELATLRGLLCDTQSQLDQQQNLTTKLEEDLLSAQSTQMNDRTRLQPGHTLEDPILGGVDAPQGADINSSQAMIGVLQHQRDRFRQKAEDLRAEVSRCQMDIAKYQSEASAMQADNVTLVERIRFLQGYRKDNLGRGDVEAGLSTEEKYSKQYEERMNPFAEFQGKQRENRKKQLGIVDKSVYIVGDLVFGNRYARMFVFLYVIVMHILVMSTLVFTSHRHGPGHLMLTEEVQRFCREHVHCKDGGVEGVGIA